MGNQINMIHSQEDVSLLTIPADMSINHQVAINATETVKEKITFEREAQSQGVAIKG